VMGIESDGAVKGCPSLQTAHYVGGSAKTEALAEIWPKLRPEHELWGFCAECPFADPCRGGCTFTARALLGRPGNNPYCHFRARTLRERGLRERLIHAERAPGTPFDNGRFELVVEPFDSPEPPPKRPIELVKLRYAHRR